MVNFSLIEDSINWNDLFVKHDNYSPYQLYQWGEYKKNQGWSVATILAEGSETKACLQITYKLKFGVFLGWCIGSISGDVALFNKEDIINYIKKHFSVKYVFIKSSFTNPFSSSESFLLYCAGWNKSSTKINSDYSIYVDLSKTLTDILSSSSKNFKRNIKRGIKNNPEITVRKLSEYNELQLVDVFDRFKKLKDVPVPSKDEIALIKHSLSENILVAVSTIGNEIVGLRACLYFGEKAIDFWAVSDLVGRKNYTSFVLLYELLNASQKEGVLEYDMAGIEPRNNQSVYSFKNGLRAGISERCGEWEISNSKILSFAINKIYL